MRADYLWARSLLMVFGLGLSQATIAVAAALPEWLVEAAKRPNPPNCGQANGAVLFDQTQITIDESGTASTLHRRAVRIITKQGVVLANASVAYIDKTDKVRANQAWLIRAGKPVKDYSGTEWVDISLETSGTIYTEFRAKVLGSTFLAMPDDVFGFETKVEGKPLFSEYSESFGGALPVLEQQFEIVVPAGWRIQDSTRSGAPLSASTSADGRTQRWTLRDWPYRPLEPLAPPGSAGAPFVYGSYAPPANSAVAIARPFGSWSDVSAWQARLTDPQCDSGPELQSKAQQLMAGCVDTPAKIRALCNYVQNFHYVANGNGLGIGFGYRPRKATEIVAKEFGDCKDKVNALRALLRESGITSHPLIVLADRNHRVCADFPSIEQFNHAIIAIEVGAGIEFPSMVSTPQWGRLLLFDPTDPNTPLGGLPWPLQGTKGMISAAGCDGLLDLPVLPAEHDHRTDRAIELTLNAEGGVGGKVLIVSYGQAGSHLRRWLRTATARDLQIGATERLSAALLNVQVTNVAPKNEPEADRCSLAFDFSAPKFSQRMPGSLELVRLDVLGRGNIPAFAEKSRETPVKLPPLEQRDEAILNLPAGLSVVERPADVVLESPYGRYSCSYEVNETRVIFHRSFSLRPIQVAPVDFTALKKYLADVAQASQATVLLRRN